MKVTKEKNEFGLRVTFEEGEKYLTFSFGGNGDLYWTIHKHGQRTDEYKYDFFMITKENYGVYRLFEELFHDIENIEIFDIEDDIPFYIDSDEERRQYQQRRKEEIEAAKERYRQYNKSNYNELFDKSAKTITWYSDETSHKVSNILRIKKEENTFRIEFYTQPYIEGYDEDFHSSGYIPIRFRNSGSSYEPFNIIFMKMYNNMQDIDDVTDFGHQIDIEEYLYNQAKVKKLIK